MFTGEIREEYVSEAYERLILEIGETVSFSPPPIFKMDCV